jgi:apolipoprotein N-acyltransferase
MLKLADWVILSSGWKRRLIALVAGAFGALAMAPFSFTPALIVTMVVAVWLLDGSYEVTDGRGFAWPGFGSLRLAFGAGWWLGFGYFLGGLWWLASAFLLVPEFAWALPLGVIGVPALLAIFMGVGFLLARLLWAPGAARILSLALALGLAEWARGHLLTGFPWNALGMALGGRVETAQPAALFGLDGLTLIAVGVFATPATLFDGENRRLTWAPTLWGIAGLAAILGFGQVRLSEEKPPDVPKVVVRIMQPGLQPDDTFTAENKDQIVARYIELSRRDDPAKHLRLEDVTMLVWPESAFPFILTRDPQALTTIGAFLPPGTALVTGAAREEEVAASDGHRAYSDYFNAIEVITAGGTIVDSYDKIHLVPFGEYLPFDALLRGLGLRNFVSIPGGFEPGRVRKALDIPGLPPAAPLICYEAIFPGEVGLSPGNGPKRARFLLNVTNDGWFGMTAGPSQHFAQSRLRAIEEGLPMVRGAATGISAIIDPYGRVVESLPLGTAGIVDGKLPSAIRPPLFARARSVSVWGLWISTFILSLLLRFARPPTV